ncbi:MAG: DUF2505 domain-containing protein [Byssovorax sp.]
MGKFSVSHEINCNVETFWKTFLDKTFNEKLYLEGLGFPAFKIVEQNETDTRITRKVQGTPKMEVPAAVAKVLGSNFSYTEEGAFDKTTKVWTWKLIPSSMPDKIKQDGKVTVVAIGDNKVRRTAEINMEAKVFMVGGLIESSGEKQLREGWDKSAVFMNKYLASAAT